MTVSTAPSAETLSAVTDIALPVAVPLHGASTPLPHWLALVAAVLVLWGVVAAGVLVCDRLLVRLGAAE